MSARVNISGREFTGRDLATIVRREYGRRARVWFSADANDPAVGRVVQRSEAGGAWSVLGVVRWVEGDVGAVDGPGVAP